MTSRPDSSEPDYRERADQHRPDAAQIRQEALRLLAAGWCIDDIAAAFRLHRSQVAGWAVEVEVRGR